MIRIAVFHTDLNQLGGSERVCLGFIEAIKDLGYGADLVTMVPSDWNRIRSVFGEIVKPDREFSLFTRPVRFEKYRRFLMYSTARNIRRFVKVTVNSAGCRWLPVPADVVYEHTTPVTLGGFLRTGVGLHARIYCAPFDLIQRLLTSKSNAEILTNSNYCAKSLRLSDTRVSVVYPPVDVTGFKVGREDRTKTVVTCGRYEPAKNYETVIEVAAKVPSARFIILGTICSYQGRGYYEELKRLIKEYSVQNVALLTNVSRQVQIEIYSRAKVYFHAMVGEDFGIAAVEGMGAGLIPVVHKSGGLWEDVVVRGKFGFGYTTVDEAVQAIGSALDTTKSFRDEVVARSKVFSKDAFKEKLLPIITKEVDEVDLKRGLKR